MYTFWICIILAPQTMLVKIRHCVYACKLWWRKQTMLCYCFGKIILCLNPIWTSCFKVISRRKGWYNSTWKGSCRPNDVWPPWLLLSPVQKGLSALVIFRILPRVWNRGILGRGQKYLLASVITRSHRLSFMPRVS